MNTLTHIPTRAVTRANIIETESRTEVVSNTHKKRTKLVKTSNLSLELTLRRTYFIFSNSKPWFLHLDPIFPSENCIRAQVQRDSSFKVHCMLWLTFTFTFSAFVPPHSSVMQHRTPVTVRMVAHWWGQKERGGRLIGSCLGNLRLHDDYKSSKC